jgi:ABC-type nitrate/sulfonate/bicarbonate transport system permease component
VRDCHKVVVAVYSFVFGFGLSSVGGFLLGLWIGLRLL